MDDLSVIEVTTSIQFTGHVDSTLLEHLQAVVEESYTELSDDDSLTPNSQEYDRTRLVPLATRATKIDPEDKSLKVILAALKHLERSLENGDDLSYLSGLIDPSLVKVSQISPLTKTIEESVDNEVLDSVA